MARGRLAEPCIPRPRARVHRVRAARELLNQNCRAGCPPPPPHAQLGKPQPHARPGLHQESNAGTCYAVPMRGQVTHQPSAVSEVMAAGCSSWSWSASRPPSGPQHPHLCASLLVLMPEGLQRAAAPACDECIPGMLWTRSTCGQAHILKLVSTLDDTASCWD